MEKRRGEKRRGEERRREERERQARGCGAHVPLKPHTSLHSIVGVFIWRYKEACLHKGQQLDWPASSDKVAFHRDHNCVKQQLNGSYGARDI